MAWSEVKWVVEQQEKADEAPIVTFDQCIAHLATHPYPVPQSLCLSHIVRIKVDDLLRADEHDATGLSPDEVGELSKASSKIGKWALLIAPEFNTAEDIAFSKAI